MVNIIPKLHIVVIFLFKKFIFFSSFVLFIILFDTHLLYSVSVKHESNDVFLNMCNISNNDLQITNFVIKNSNDRYIQSSIEDIENQTLKQAVYLLIFYRHNNGYFLTNGAVEAVGYNTIMLVKSLSVPFLNYLLKQQMPFSNFKEALKPHRLTFVQKKNLLLNPRFATSSRVNSADANNNNFEYVNELLKQLFGNLLISFDEIIAFQKLYPLIVSDEMLMQQIRMRLFKNNTNNVSKLINVMKNDIMKNHAKKLVYFYNHHSLKKLQKKSLKYQKARTNYSCIAMVGYDEYSDLICLKKNAKNTKFVKKVLADNNNPSFLPSEWFKYRVKFARNVISSTNNLELKTAYNIIASSGYLTGEDYYVQQFLSGFIAFLSNDFQTASMHFSKCGEYATHSNERGKAFYWLAITYKKLGEERSYREALMQSAENKLSLYGQLAMDDLNINAYEYVKNNIEHRVNISSLCNDAFFVASYISQLRYENSISGLLLDFINAYRNNKNKLYNSLIVVNNDFNTKIGLLYARYLRTYDVALENITFPLMEMTDDSLINAVIQQESCFKTNAVSNKGARGVMQIMPSTGKKIAKSMNIKYDHKRLLYDKGYNVRMGQFYLKQLLDRFNGHKLLALASYNAGSGNTLKWIQQNGDPRDMKTNEEIAMWIEKIPFAQTREYVIKILGAEMVYDAIKKLKEERKV